MVDLFISGLTSRTMKSVTLTQRVHLFPFRTQKLSFAVPTILAWRRAGKIGRDGHYANSFGVGVFLSIVLQFLSRCVILLVCYVHLENVSHEVSRNELGRISHKVVRNVGDAYEYTKYSLNGPETTAVVVGGIVLISSFPESLPVIGAGASALVGAMG